MAGIGFVLRRLANREDLTGILQGYLFSAVISSGPWLFTIIALGSMEMFGSLFVSHGLLSDFRLVVIYNFGFSLVTTGPVYMVCTRYLSDLIYAKKVQHTPGMLMGSLLLILVYQAVISGWFYFYQVEMQPYFRWAAFINYLLICLIWQVTIFLTALKDYTAISITFALGLILALLAAIAMVPLFGAAGMMTGFNIGLLIIFSSICARIFAEFPYPFIQPFAFLSYFRRYWELAAAGALYNLASWIDKWVMWFAPEREYSPAGMFSFPNYDTPMFLALLTVVPAMAYFLFNIETAFFERYLSFFRNIGQHSTYAHIRNSHQAILRVIYSNGRNLIIIQGGIAFVAIMTAPKLLPMLHLSHLQLGIFRLAVLGVFFQTLSLFLMVVLTYFDARKLVVWVLMTFLVTNLLFSIISLNLGFTYYGLGYVLSTIITFATAFMVTLRFIHKLPYMTFVRNNTSIT
ncbi:exopolysaccharide Pel transporter PelG [Magnetococcus sp. PR-3]|uniref:exopolysaccharide Pel transporter PelG n=1 Tax=Magnetococcus sp. PR-3 TaxID=3120355 RepID=UPI002FCE280C